MHDERSPRSDTIRLTAHEGQSKDEKRRVGPICSLLTVRPASIVGRRSMRLARSAQAECGGLAAAGNPPPPPVVVKDLDGQVPEVREVEDFRPHPPRAD
jgi:hypothetical protein